MTIFARARVFRVFLVLRSHERRFDHHALARVERARREDASPAASIVRARPTATSHAVIAPFDARARHRAIARRQCSSTAARASAPTGSMRRPESRSATRRNMNARRDATDWREG